MGAISVKSGSVSPGGKRARSIGFILAGVAFLGGAPEAIAAPDIAMDSTVYVERTAQDNVRRLEPANQLSRGDRVVTVLSWHRRSGNGGFTIVNPLPRAIAFQDSADADMEVSVDEGRTWGRLGELKIGQHVATAEDVTHVRWRIPATSVAKGRGNIAYSAIVR